MILIMYAAYAACGMWLIREWEDFQKRRKSCLIRSMKYYAAMCILMLVLSFLLAGILKEPSAAQKADEALYAVKHASKNGFCKYSPELG